jgi:hypothetical protein
MSFIRKPLFRERGDLRTLLDAANIQAKQRIDNLEENYLLNVSEEDIISVMAEDQRLEPVVLKKDDIHVTRPKEVEVDVSNDPGYGAYLLGEKASVPGVSFSVVVPFDGTPDLFHFQPQSYTSPPTIARVQGQALYFDYEGVGLTKEQVQRQYKSDLEDVENNLRSATEQINRYNGELPNVIRNALRSRKARLLKNRDLVESLGLPLKPRGVSSTYSVPVTRRKTKLELPEALRTPFKPEPALVEDDYSAILEIIQNLALAMERSPRAFAKLNEEEIRDFIVVYLNGYYEGQATGETFNFEGKTDILIRHLNRNIFVADCKFWKGEQGLLDAIDQLLGYTCWRDTKTAIVVFNRNKDFTAVLSKIQGVVPRHPNFKKNLGQSGESRFRFLFHHRDDRNRELTLSILAFDIPVPNAS